MILTGLGRLGRDVVVRQGPDGTAVANLAIAYNYGKKDDQGNRATQWIDAALWGERATKLAEYLKKGTQLDVVLSDVAVNTFQKSDGSTGTSIKARVISLEFAGTKRDDAAPAKEAEKAPAQAAPASKPAAAKGAFDDFEDDIPF